LSVGSGDFTWVGWVAGVDREGIVEHDTVDGVLFCIRLHAGCMCLTCCKESYGSVFVLGWVV